jgi:hypothetical protein
VFILYSNLADEEWVQRMAEVMVEGRTTFYENSKGARAV